MEYIAPYVTCHLLDDGKVQLCERDSLATFNCIRDHSSTRSRLDLRMHLSNPWKYGARHPVASLLTNKNGPVVG